MSVALNEEFLDCAFDCFKEQLDDVKKLPRHLQYPTMVGIAYGVRAFALTIQSFALRMEIEDAFGDDFAERFGWLLPSDSELMVLEDEWREGK